MKIRKKQRKTIRAVSFLLVLCIVFAGCMFSVLFDRKNEAEPQNPAEPNPVSGDTKEKDEIIGEMVADMSVSDLVYQMMFVTPESITNVGTVVAAGETTRAALERQPVGGIIYFAKNLENREQTIEMIKNTQEYSKIPLFIAVDEEGGRVARLGSNKAMGTTILPPMRQIGDTKDPQKAYDVGETLAKDLLALGFNVDFAPDADVLINEKNSEIGDRSFGTDPNLVAMMVENVVSGMEKNGVSATLKHFPGHGSTYVDSHTGYSASTRTLDELRSKEFLPFVSGIHAGADFVMVSHMTLVNATQEKVPSSVSKEVITDWLLGELGYEGIVITDSFSMGAVTEMYSPGQAAVKAVNAGCDMILMSSDLASAHKAIVDAVEKGEISRERIETSVKKILTLKYDKGLFE